MEYELKIKNRNVSEKELLADLRSAAKKLGKSSFGYAEYETVGKFCASTFSLRFGRWNAALIKAGLKVKKVWRIADDELMNELKRVWDSLGRQPRSDEMFRPLSKYCHTTFARHFGSWNNALFAFIEAVNNGKYKSGYKRTGRKPNSIKIKGIRKPLKLHVNKSMRFDVLSRDKYKCRLCGASPAKDINVTLHVDHIIPSSKGGENILSNLQTLCSDCNLGKAAKTMKAGKRQK